MPIIDELANALRPTQDRAEALKALKALEEDLTTFYNAHKKSANYPVIGAIKSWFKTDQTETRSVPKRSESIKLLVDFIEYALTDRENYSELEEASLIQIKIELNVLITEKAAKKLPKVKSKANAEPKFGYDELQIFSAILEGSSVYNKVLPHDFACDPPTDSSQQYIYFLMYRFSTEKQQVLKSFVVIESPLTGVSYNWSFKNFVWSRKGSVKKNVYKITKGTVLRLTNYYSLLGAVYSLNEYPHSEKRLRNVDWKKSSNKIIGIEVIGFESDSMNTNRYIIPSVIFTQAAGRQPIVARAALIRIGSRRNQDVALFDDELVPTELNISELNENIEKDLIYLHSRDFQLVGGVGEDDVKANAKTLSHEILKIIDNMSAAENVVQEKDCLKVNRGALETYAEIGRPRE